MKLFTFSNRKSRFFQFVQMAERGSVDHLIFRSLRSLLNRPIGPLACTLIISGSQLRLFQEHNKDMISWVSG